MKVDVVIIGAGPSGLTAAIELIHHGLSVAVIDEYYRPGGRLLGQHYEDPKAPPDERIWNGKEIAEQLAEKARNLGVHIFTEVTAWSVSREWKIDLTGANVKAVFSKVLLLATGSIEKALPIPGWTLPGAVSIGAAQTFTNLHHVAVGKKVMIVGVDPLSLSVMMEMKNAGIDVAGMVLPPLSPALGQNDSPKRALKRLKDVVDLAPNLFMRAAGKIALSKFPNLTAQALRFNFLKVNGVPIHFRKSIVRIEGDKQVEAVMLQSISVDGHPTGKVERVEMDAVCLSAGLYPMVDLAQTAGCPLVEIPELGGAVPLHGSDMSTPVRGLYVAGNITGIEGAKVAMAQGKLAAVTILKSMGRQSSLTVNEAMVEVKKAREMSPLRFLPKIEEGRSKMEEVWKKEGII
ncbi:FAD-binding protein [Siminovitchia acidinfaciens]|uniref:FAD-binding protein n=1 Tax=Siminovitchia acidinfaciens TaxID=2321395 RepID=A0A429XVB2_9BACI|nr:FAD-dependent oxidoreductase [Siminovitchia acidinfaciens]RST72045.1 FAD-binding protein [Siminovitchia acidinfaciens]